MSIIVKEVTSKKELLSFVRFPNILYKDNQYYVPQIESMDMATLDPKRNHAFEVCKGKYFLAYDDSTSQVVGRVAAIVNQAYNEKVNERICRFSFLDFIEDQTVISKLMECVENFAKENNLNKISGPVGFLEFDPAGILVEGFDEYPTAYGKYNAPYYKDMIERLGYNKETDWIEFSIDIRRYNKERNHSAAEYIASLYSLHQAPIKHKKDIFKYIDGVFDLMNRCYSDLHGYSNLSDGQLEDLKKQFIPNIDPDLVSIILDKSERVIAFCVLLPSLSKALIKAKGRLFPFGFIHILKALKHNDTADALLIAIDTEYRSRGVNAMMFDKVYYGIKKIGIQFIESTRELEDNFSVQNLFRRFHPRLHKRARCYTKLLDI